MRCAAATPFDEAQVEAAVRGTAVGAGIKAGALIHATRVAVTGRTQSPGLFEVLAWLGRDRVRARLAQLLEFLAARVAVGIGAGLCERLGRSLELEVPAFAKPRPYWEVVQR